MKQLYKSGLLFGVAITTLVGCSTIRREPVTLQTAVNRYMASIQAEQSSVADDISGIDPYNQLSYQSKIASKKVEFGSVKLKFSGNVKGLDYRSNIGGDRVKLEATVKAELPELGDITFRVVDKGRGKSIETVDEVYKYFNWAKKHKTPVTFIGYTSNDFDPAGPYNKRTIDLIRIEIESVKDDIGNLHENVAIDTADSWEERYEDSAARTVYRAARAIAKLVPGL